PKRKSGTEVHKTTNPTKKAGFVSYLRPMQMGLHAFLYLLKSSRFVSFLLQSEMTFSYSILFIAHYNGT
ncbi:hypothetical protein, partial [Thiopseudomonas alkaliphila]|uniref:hypothetical protein n=1 Tax=Thiopseudomonas alkaliphila TaxID=1697053 RepID=UPI0025789E68